MSKNESGIQKEIINYLEELQFNIGKCYVLRVNSGFATMGTRVIQLCREGTPDIIVCFNGNFIALEVKTSKGKQSDPQMESQLHIEQSGGEYYIVRSLDEVKLIIK